MKCLPFFFVPFKDLHLLKSFVNNLLGKRDIIMDSQLPAGMDAKKLRELDLPAPQEAPPEDFKPQPPKFITQIQPQENLQEGDSAHFECRLEPTNDPKLRVEWYHNGKPLKSGNFFFFFVSLFFLHYNTKNAL